MTSTFQDPNPKDGGYEIRAKDWNDIVEELKRLDTAKPDSAGNEWDSLLERLQALENRKVRAGGDTMAVQNRRVGIGNFNPMVTLHLEGDRIRLEKPGTNQTLDLRADGGALDIQSENADLYLNNNNRPVRIRNLVQGSSRAWKEETQELSGAEARAVLDRLQPQVFRFKEDRSHRRHMGFIAEEMPDDLTTPEKEGFNPTAIIAVLTRVVKEQQRALETLNREVRLLRRQAALGRTLVVGRGV